MRDEVLLCLAKNIKQRGYKAYDNHVMNAKKHEKGGRKK